MALKKDVANVFFTVVTEMALGGGIYANMIEVAASGNSVMQEEPQENFGFVKKIVPLNKLEVFVLKRRKSGTPKTGVRTTSGEGSSEVVILNYFIIRIGVQSQRGTEDVSFNGIGNFKRKPCEIPIPIIVELFNSDVGYFAINRALDDASKASQMGDRSVLHKVHFIPFTNPPSDAHGTVFPPLLNVMPSSEIEIPGGGGAVLGPRGYWGCGRVSMPYFHEELYS